MNGKIKRTICLWFAFICVCLSAFAQRANTAQQLYKQKDYVGAAAVYEKMLADTITMQDNAQLRANVCYNLGNCYYKTQNYALAILNYQRVLRINPSDKDAAFNLQLTQAKLQDQFTPPSEMFFITWGRMLVKSVSATIWGYIALILLCFTTIAWLCFKWNDRLIMKKVNFIWACISIAVSLLCFLFAYVENNWLYAEKQVVITKNTQTYDSPTPWAKSVKELHEGVLLDVVDEQKGGWLMVEMPDGKNVWIKDDAVTIV